MLKSLSITNFALIEHTVIEFSSGLNVLTGETGAGKSILIDALGVVLGNRASSEMIRENCEFLRVEAVFDIKDHKELSFFLEEQGITIDESEELIISRRLTKQGKNNIVLQGCTVPLAILRQVGEKLVDMHGQHDNQKLLRPETHLALLDSYNSNIKAVLGNYTEIYHKWVKINQEIRSLEQNARAHAQRLDTLNWQVEEIAAANLKDGEDAELEQEIKILANAEKIAGAISRANALFGEGKKGSIGIIAALGEIKRELENVVKLVPKFEQQLQTVSEVLYQLEDVNMDINNAVSEIEYSPEKLAAFQARMDIIYKLKKKYGQTIDEILQYYNQAKHELSLINNYEETLQEQTANLSKTTDQLTVCAAKLDVMRRETAVQLCREIEKHLADLAMLQAKVVIEVNTEEKYSSRGNNEVVFLFSANPGESPKPVHKIASGGELSRIALALKAICVDDEAVMTMVFDEIDSGVGGQTAMAMAEKIAYVAKGRQVLCITHLPQIACMADWHLYIEKKIVDDKTATGVTILSDNERLIELTRMISGNNVSQIAIENAAQMMKLAKKTKEKWKERA